MTEPQETLAEPPKRAGSKYHRAILTVAGTTALPVVDVYCVLEAFAVVCPARQHAIKKLLCAGLRGKGAAVQDLRETADAVQRAIELEEQRKGASDNDGS